MRIRHGTVASAIFRRPLMRAGRTLRQFPFVFEQVLEEIVAPLGRRRGPSDFQATADGVSRPACAERTLPAESLRLDLTAFRIHADLRRGARAVGLAEG